MSPRGSDGGQGIDNPAGGAAGLFLVCIAACGKRRWHTVATEQTLL